MISQALLAGICDDVGTLFQMSCDHDSQTVIASELFKVTAEKIRTEKPDLSDTEILAGIVTLYSEAIRNQ